MDWGSIPQWATVVIAVVAGIIAYSSVMTQRDTARRRASLDLLLKTVTDPAFNKVLNEYLATIQKFNDSEKPANVFFNAEENSRAVAPYMNVLDLIGVGVHNGILN